MKKLLRGFVLMSAMFCGVNTAVAGSLGDPEMVRPVPRPDFHASQSNFAGFYAGALAAQGTATTEVESQYYRYGPIARPAGTAYYRYPAPARNFMLPMEADGWQGGVFVGYNWDVGQPQGWVVGVEADYMAGSLSYSNAGTSKYIADIGQREFSVSDQATLRGRVGYDLGNVMPYVALGASCAHIETHNVQWMVQPHHSSGTQCGPSGAIGADVALGNNMLLGVEYRMTHYGDTDVEQGLLRVGWRF